MQQLQNSPFWLYLKPPLSCHDTSAVWCEREIQSWQTLLIGRGEKNQPSPHCFTLPYYFQGWFFAGLEINSELFCKPLIFSANILFYYLPFCCWFSFFLLLLFFFFLIHSTIYWIFYSPVCISSLLHYLLLFTDKHLTPGRQAPLISIKTWSFFPSLFEAF